MLTPATPAGPGKRLVAVDLARGLAIVAMVVYHATWDLHQAGRISLDPVADPAWRLFARAIAGTFLFLSGISLVLAHRQALRWGAFARRLAILAASAALVSGATWLMVGDQYVRFGILHAIATASVVGLLFLRTPPPITAVAAVAAFVAPQFLTSSAFDHPAWIWLGLGTDAPDSVDYVPLFPWLAPFLMGMAVARAALGAGLDARIAMLRPRDPLSRALAAAGRWSLAIYLVHQPLLIGALRLAALIAPLPPAPAEGDPNLAAAAASFGQVCRTSCETAGGAAPICRTTCACVLDGLRRDGILADAVTRSDPSISAAIRTITDACVRPAGEAGR